MKIKANILPEIKMKELGFTDYNKDYWYFFKKIKGIKNISFNVTINKNNQEDLNINVLDEKFLQPYDYQYILERNPTFQPCLIVKEEVEKWMKYLVNSRVLTDYIYGEYI